MKSTTSLLSRRQHEAPRRGVALLLVLSCLVLLAALILGFLLASQNNLKSSKLYANGSSVKTLADSTVSLVMAQIQQATSNGTTVAWASQPGMIRTYNQDGSKNTNYRLYSWDQPTVTGSFVATTDSGSLTTTGGSAWYNSPALFYDLNQPVADGSGTLHYPIVDGNPADLTGTLTTAVTGTTSTTATVNTYTINGLTPGIEGFYVGQPNSTSAVAGPAVNLTGTTNAPNSIPMPVKWLYVLKDGTVVSPSGSGSQVSVHGASTANPIVGRMAYWTDDETSKVNINTASEGAYWDQPRSQGKTDYNLAVMQPVQNEYQRYPGHPATTSLSTVFGSISYIDPTLTATNAILGSITGSLSYAPYQFYYDLAPKLNADTGLATGTSPATAPDNLGSRAGTVVWYYSGSSTATVPNATGSGTIGGYLTQKNAGTGTVGTTGGDRLYASVDELLFKSNLFTDNVHIGQVTVSGTGTPAQRPLTSSINQQFLEQAQFFLTANSRAPDVNLFNQPRIVTWPINASTGSTYQTTLDQAIAWCGTMNKHIFYFERSRNDHPTNDLPSTTASGTTTGQTLTRNRNLINYLANETSQNIPGFGGNFLAKYPAATIDIGGTLTTVVERDQIQTEIFDYIRCLDLQDSSTISSTFHQFAPVAALTVPYNYSAAWGGTTAYGDPTGSTGAGNGDIGSNFTTAPGINNAGKGQVVPIYDTLTHTKGFGRFPTVAEVSIMFVTTGWNDGIGGLSGTLNSSGTFVANPNYAASTAVPPSANVTTATVGGVSAPWGYYNDGTNGLPATVPTGPKYNATYMSGGSSASTALTGTWTGSGPTATLTGTLQVRPIVIVSFFDPSCGFVTESPTFSIQISGLNNFTWTNDDGTSSAMFPNATGSGIATSGTINPQGGGPNMGNYAVCPAFSNMPGWGYAAKYSQSWGGNLGFREYITGNTLNYAGGQNSDGGYPFIGTAHNFKYYPLSASTNTTGTFAFSGGALTVNILLPSTGVNAMVDSRWNTRSATPGWPPTSWPLTPTGSVVGTGGVAADMTPVQQINVYFPPVPKMPLPYYPTPALNATGTIPYSDRGNFYNRLGEAGNSNFNNINTDFTAAGDVIRSVRAVPGDMRMIAGRVSITDTNTSGTPAPGYFDPTQTLIQNSGLAGWDYFNSTLTSTTTSTGSVVLIGSNTYQVHSLVDSLSYPFYGAVLGQLVPGVSYAREAIASPFWSLTLTNTSTGMGNCALATGALMPASKIPWLTGATTIAGDWDNGFAFVPDGSYINKPDEGQSDYTVQGSTTMQVPYYGNAGWGTSTNSGVSYFSPNRLMPGPGMFGSLSTGVIRNIPWMTLLFCPNPEGASLHPGFGVGSGTAGPTDVPPYTYPPDHLWLDLFNMPVVEPYPISEPLSTAGRINMNYQIVPFTYIERSTGVRAVLKSEKIIAISDDAAATYKAMEGDGTGVGHANFDFRLPINLDQTLLGFDYYFSSTGDIFRSATQICNMFLYPTRDTNGSTTNAPTWDSANANINKFWYGTKTPTGAYSVNVSTPTHFLTGDNSRERPYTTIYPRLTTKSNTFTVHYCVQTLQQVTADATAGQWTEGTDQVTGQYRGSTIIERYVDPNDTTLPDFAAADGSGYSIALDKWYKFRVVSTKQFAP